MITEKQWERVKGYLQPALDRGGNTHTTDDIRAGVISGLYQLWVGDKSAAVSRIESFPAYKICRVFLAGGDLGELKKIEREITSFAKHHDCRALQIIGRPGWERALENYKKAYVVLNKELF
ncbi:hypothetical protein [Kiloniella litopenaei]|uniref:hypothetical protein n=1 Tax=Kiloniella litopenaei TaxID=1549748 RepID=UPI003BA9F43B